MAHRPHSVAFSSFIKTVSQLSKLTIKNNSVQFFLTDFLILKMLIALTSRLMNKTHLILISFGAKTDLTDGGETDCSSSGYRGKVKLG